MQPQAPTPAPSRGAAMNARVVPAAVYVAVYEHPTNGVRRLPVVWFENDPDDGWSAMVANGIEMELAHEVVGLGALIGVAPATWGLVTQGRRVFLTPPDADDGLASIARALRALGTADASTPDRKSTRLNSSHRL